MLGKGEYMEREIRVGNQWVSLDEFRARRLKVETREKIKAIVGIGIIVFIGGFLLFAI